MIIDKPPLPDDPTPTDAPPSYDELQRPVSPSSYPQDNKTGPSQPFPSPSSPASSSSLKPPPISHRPSKGKKSKWFPFGQSSQSARTQQEVKETILGLVRDVVRAPEPSAAISILKDCASACATHELSFSALLQDKSVEGHTPIYWSIVKRPAEPQSPTDIDLVATLLSLAAPLTPVTVSEIRLACLQNSDQVLFQRLRRLPTFAPVSGTDEILLGVSVAPDEIEVQDLPGDEGAFAASFRIAMFHKRMRVSKSVRLEFIARGRMWCLEFLVVDGTHWNPNYVKGTWLVSLTLMEHSPPTFFDSRLLIEEAKPSLPSSPTGSSIGGRKSSTISLEKSKPKPTIELRLKTAIQLGPKRSSHRQIIVDDITVPLSKSPMGNSLQYDGCSYIASDGSLSARLEASLTKPDKECIIC